MANSPSILLLPGLDGTGRLFSPFLRALPANLSAQAVRYPLEASLGYRELEGVVRAALPREGSVVLVAESFSGPLAIRVAVGEPRVRGLVLVASFARNPLPGLAPLRALAAWLPSPRLGSGLVSWLLLGPSPPAELRRELRAALAAVPLATLRRRVAEVLAVDARSELARVPCPILVLAAGNDRLVPRRAGREIERLAARAHVVELAGPHLLLQTCPGEAARSVAAFVELLS